MKEKISIVQNETKILRSESLAKEGLLSDERCVLQLAQSHRFFFIIIFFFPRKKEERSNTPWLELALPVYFFHSPSVQDKTIVLWCLFFLRDTIRLDINARSEKHTEWKNTATQQLMEMENLNSIILRFFVIIIFYLLLLCSLSLSQSPSSLLARTHSPAVVCTHFVPTPFSPQ